jgi:gas vesicle protein
MMQVKSWLVTLGVGAAAGAVAAMMLPKHSTARRLVNKAAYAVEDAAMMVGDKISDALDM